MPSPPAAAARAAMRAPGFWWAPPGLAARLLGPAGALYGAVTAARMARPGGARGAGPVVCVGNFVAGGAGKTPVVLALAALMGAPGRRIGFLTRGYGGRLAGPVLVDRALHDAVAVGDEALLLAAAGPTVVARDRAAGLALVAASAPDLCLMDDGLQNPSVAKDLAFAVVDGAVGVGSGRCLPAGPLRAPLAAQMPRVDAVILLRPDGLAMDGDVVAPVTAAARAARRPVLGARLVQRGLGPLAGRRLVAFAGIGRPEKMFGQLRAAGLDLAATRAFPDHHPFTEADARGLLADAAAVGAALVTTDKDRVRLAGHGGARGDLAAAVQVVGVEAVFDDPEQVRALVAGAMARRSGG